MRWKDDPGLYGWVPCNHMILKTGTQGNRVGQRDVVVKGLDPLLRVLKLEKGGRWLWKLEAAFSLQENRDLSTVTTGYWNLPTTSVSRGKNLPRSLQEGGQTC